MLFSLCNVVLKNVKAPGDKSTSFSRTIGAAIRSVRKESCREKTKNLYFFSHIEINNIM